MNTLSCLLIITCLLLLGLSHLNVSVRMMAAQGMILGIMPFMSGPGHFQLMAWVLGLSSFIIKGIVLPSLLFHVLKRSAIRREIEPYVGFNISIMIGILMLASSSYMAMYLLSNGGGFNPVLLSAALFTVMTGLFLVISRRKAITQALGYLVMENGIYAVGIGIGTELNAIVELGVLLDVSVGVFIMGIMLFHINQEFDHIDADQLNELSDYHASIADEEVQ